MERISDFLKSAKGAVGSALENAQANLIQNKAGTLLPKAIEQGFVNLDPVLQMELAGALKEICDQFDGENGRDLDWQRLMQNPGTKALMGEIVKEMVRNMVPKI